MHTQTQRLLPAPRQPVALLYPGVQAIAVRLLCRVQEGNTRVTWTGRPLSEVAGRAGRYQIAQDSDGAPVQAWVFQDGSLLARDCLGLYAAFRQAADAGLVILASE